MLQNLPNVIPVTRDNYLMYRGVIEQSVLFSVNSTIKYTQPPTSFDVDAFFNWLQTEDNVFLLNRNSKLIGLVVLHSTEVDDEVLTSFTTFLHPKVCKMAAISLLKGGLCLSAIHSVINQSKTSSTYLYHSILVSTLRNTFPDVSLLRLSSLIQLCNISLEKYPNLKVLKEHLIQVYDQEVVEYFDLF